MTSTTLAFALLLGAGSPLPETAAEPSASPRPELVTAQVLPAPAAHAFWDWQNLGLFSGVAAARAFDFYSTRRFREKRLKEWFLDDKTVDNRPLFLTIEAAGVLVSVGASYLLHRTGHHRLERWVSILHIGVATAGGIWNCTLPNGL